MQVKTLTFTMENIFNNPAFAHILEEIFLYLSIEDLKNCRGVSKNFKAVLDQPRFWLKKNQIDGVIRKPYVKFWMNLIGMIHATELENNLTKALVAINAKDNNLDVDPMAEFVRIGDLALMKFVLDNTEKLQLGSLETHFLTPDGKTPLHMAVDFGNIEMVKLMAPYYKNMNCVDYFRRSSLHYAAVNGDINMMKTLLPLVDNIYPVDKWNLTPSTFLYGMALGFSGTSEKHADVLKYFYSYVEEVKRTRKGPQYDNLPASIKS